MTRGGCSDPLNATSALGAHLVCIVPETQRRWAEHEYAHCPTTVVGDVTGALKKWFDARPVGVVFLRPDRFVAAACLAQETSPTLRAVLAAMSYIPAPGLRRHSARREPTMPVAAVCMSHSPLLEFAEPPHEVRAAVDAAFAAAREFVAAFDPTLVVSIAPDHYNGFFHDLMPPYCVGFAAHAVGDYGSQAGPLDVPGELAAALAQHVLDADVDIAISRRMEIDHGAVQPLEILFGDIAARPTVPIFVNSVAQPFAPMRRVRRMGAAVGGFLGGLQERVLLIGSGGLSHDPPVPQWATATPEQREVLLAGRHPTAAARAARQQRVIDTAEAFAAGTADIMDLNPGWDEEFMDLCAAGELERIDAFTPTGMAAVAGNSAHEVRTWLAAHSALSAAAGGYRVEYRFYRPIRELIAGFGVMAARGTGA